MAYISDTAFEIKGSNHEFDSTANITGLFRNSSDAAEDCSAGFLCTRDEEIPNEGYTGIKNTNTWYMTTATAAANQMEPIYACNTFGVNEVKDPVTGAVYKVGPNTLGLPIPAGEMGTFTEIKFNNVYVYRFGIGNVNGTIGSNTIFTISAGLLVPASAAPTTSLTPYFKLKGTGNFTQGAYNSFQYVDVIACMTGVAASA